MVLIRPQPEPEGCRGFRTYARSIPRRNKQRGEILFAFLPYSHIRSTRFTQHPKIIVGVNKAKIIKLSYVSIYYIELFKNFIQTILALLELINNKNLFILVRNLNFRLRCIAVIILLTSLLDLTVLK